MDGKLYSDSAKGSYVCFTQEKGLWTKWELELAEILADSVGKTKPPLLIGKNLGTILTPRDLQGLVEDKEAMDKVKLNFSRYSPKIQKSRGKRREFLRQRGSDVVDWLYHASCAISRIKP